MNNQKFKFSRLYKPNTARRQSFKITLIYFILGCLWIIATDLMANRLILTQYFDVVALSILKGLLYVFVTSALLYKLIHSAFLKLKKSELQLKKSELLFEAIFEQAPIGIAVVNNYTFLSEMNSMFEKILGRTKEELAKLDWIDITHPDDIKGDVKLFKKFKKGIIKGYSMEKRFVKPDGKYVWVFMVIANINISNITNSNNHLCIISDITEWKITQQSLTEIERSKSVLLSNLPGIAYRCRIEEGSLITEFLSEGCYELTGYKSESLLGGNGSLMYGDLILDRHKQFTENEWKNAVCNKTPYRYEYEILSASGEEKWVLEIGQGIYDKDGNAEAIEGIIIDITESKKRIEQIEFMSNHDYLTGLYNRRYYEMEKLHIDFYTYLPISIIMADINGLRLINNTFGHAEGDKLIIETAKILKSCCKSSDILARTGGDEFCILMTNTSESSVNETIARIKEECDKYNKKLSNAEQYINISIGSSTKNTKDENLNMCEKEANEYMLKRKILDRKSYHNALLSSIMATMYARSHETEAHAIRIEKNCLKIGERMQLNQRQMDDLHLYSMLHDIGKVSIDDRILNKQSKLTEREWAIMKTHPEIGCRIALSVPEIASIADYILSHHERWDGTGYPRGHKGEEIPLLSRILAIADAYDAMTEGRIYRKAISSEEAIEEIRKNTGSQFDPEIVDIFLEIIKNGN